MAGPLRSRGPELQLYQKPANLSISKMHKDLISFFPKMYLTLLIDVL